MGRTRSEKRRRGLGLKPSEPKWTEASGSGDMRGSVPGAFGFGSLSEVRFSSLRLRRVRVLRGLSGPKRTFGS